MAMTPVQLEVGGQTYRVVASAASDELRRLAAVVDGRLRALTPPGKKPNPQALLLVALALAHELEVAEAARAESDERARRALLAALERVDDALSAVDDARSAAHVDSDAATPSR